MKLPNLSDKTDILLVLFGLSFVIFGWFALSLTLGSVFQFAFLAIGFALSFSLSLFVAVKLFLRSSIDLRIIFVLSLLYATLIGFTTEPTLFSGRDQGSIAEAAYRLAQNTELAFSLPAAESFFDIYGPGKAYNFPGFAYTKEGYLITQFPLAYTSWLASFISLFGLHGYAIANALLLFLFLFTLYSLLRLFVTPFYAVFGFALAVFAFLPSWFAKLTLTENLSVFLFTFLTLNFVLFLREGKFVNYAAILLTAGLFAFTRIEGFLFLALSVLLLALRPETKAIVRTYPWKSVVFPGIIFLYFFLRDFFLNLPYYRMIGKAFFNFVQSLNTTDPGTVTAGSNTLSFGSIFFLYGLLVLFALGLFGIILFIREKRYTLLLPAFLTLPVFIYLFHPGITLDHPWMLRRYLFSLFPTLLFSAVVCMALLFARDKSFPLKNPGGKRSLFAGLIFLGLILLQLPAWSAQLTFAENRTLLQQIENFSRQFSDRDLILVDRGVTGSGFAMLTGPAQFLYHKNAVYFFNPYDLSALDTSRYEHVYLIVPTESQSRYAAVFGDKMVLKEPVVFSLEQFEYLPFSPDSASAFHLPEKKVTETHNLLFQIY